MTSASGPAGGRRVRRSATGRLVLLAFAAGLILLLGAVRLFEQRTGTSVFVRYGGALWLPISETTPWLPRPIRLALHRPPPVAQPGPITWRRLAPGFEIAELPVRAQELEVDRIALARIDPARYRFVVRNDPTGRRNLDRWMRELGASLVMNGSYYARDGRPQTPAVSDGVRLGPARYDARQGAFVASAGGAAVVDLTHRDWRAALNGAAAAMVSYPLLIAEDGASRAPTGTGWLANRTFVGEDRSGMIILGTTKGAFFSLDRLADFLKRSPLDLKLALDLDGGPVACQGIAVNGFRRMTCGKWEIQVDKTGQAKILPTWPFAHAAMPMVLAVFPR